MIPEETMNGRKRWLGVFVFVIGSLLTASAADTFADRLAALQSRLQSDPTNTLILFQLGDLCYHEGANNNEKASHPRRRLLQASPGY